MGWLTKVSSTLVTLGLIGVVAAGGFVLYLYDRYEPELPDHRALERYEPPTVTRIYAGDGRLLAEYAREKRVFVPIADIPPLVRNAFIAAEDKSFYAHFGVNPLSIARAMVDNVQRFREGRRLIGASTITQQVAKNFLLTNEFSLERKIKEAFLAIRLEQAFGKDKILELYLNEIFLGERSYGVAAAALNYFDKSLDELDVAEAAFLGGLPQAPSRYHPIENREVARERRDYVLRRMFEDGYIDEAGYREAKARPVEMKRRSGSDVARAEFFTEEVRRRLVDRFGADGFYGGGFSVRTTLSPRLQNFADAALRRGLSEYDRRHGWRGPYGRIDLDEAGDDWPAQLAARERAAARGDWRLAVALDVDEEFVAIGFADGTVDFAPFADMQWARRAGDGGALGAPPRSPADVLRKGDLAFFEPIEDEDGERWALRQQPEVDGALVAIDPHTGRVLALSGGFDFRRSSFNRATQAKRQPGSAFKPFVYLAAFEEGFTPTSIVLDGPIAIDQGPGLPLWRPTNYGSRFYGPSTLRLGVEKSRNLMTVRLAQEIGMERVIDVARRFGIDEGLETNLASALGSNEVDLLSMTAAYAALVNGGRELRPALIERIQDRYGRTVVRRDRRECEGCAALSWREGAPPPELEDERRVIADRRHAFQLTKILEGVVERGTAQRALSIGKPVAGKTGTTNESRDAWFVGFAPDLAVGVYVGYDEPRSLGERETGSSVALPIWIDFMTRALDDAVPFRTPPDVRMVKVDAETGLLPRPGANPEDLIDEAFLPGTEPRRRAKPPSAARTVSGSNAPASSSRNAAPTRSVIGGGLY